MERDHDRAAKLAHEVEDVVTVAAASDAVLVLDRDHVDSAVVESARNEDVVRPHVAADPVAYFGWIRTRLVGGVKRHDLAVAHGTRQIVGELSLIHISEPTRLGMISYAVFCLKKKN